MTLLCGGLHNEDRVPNGAVMRSISLQRKGLSLFQRHSMMSPSFQKFGIWSLGLPDKTLLESAGNRREPLRFFSPSEERLDAAGHFLPLSDAGFCPVALISFRILCANGQQSADQWTLLPVYRLRCADTEPQGQLFQKIRQCHSRQPSLKI